MNKGKNSYLAILNDIEPDNQPYVDLGTISGILLGTHISDRKRLQKIKELLTAYEEISDAYREEPRRESDLDDL